MGVLGTALPVAIDPNKGATWMGEEAEADIVVHSGKDRTSPTRTFLARPES